MNVNPFKSSRRRTNTGSEQEAFGSNNTTQQPELSNKAPSPIVTSGLSDDYDHILDKLPDAVIAKGLRIHGEAKFSRLLRIDGAFEGVLLSDGGSLIVGETGEVTCDISNLQELYVEGRFVGDIGAEKVQLRKGAIVKGNITCCSLGLDPSARFKGSTNITPRAKWTDKQQASDNLEMNLKAMADSRHNTLDSRHYKRISTAAAASKTNSVNSPAQINGDSSIPPMTFEDEENSDEGV